MGEIYIFGFTQLVVYSVSTIGLTILLSIVSSVLGIKFSRALRKSGYSFKKNLIYSSVLALTFWLTHIFISLSTSLPISDGQFVYFLSNYVFCFIGSFVALKMGQNQLDNSRQYIFGSLVISFSILGADYVGFYYLFHEFVVISPILVIMTSLLTLGSSLSILRFLNQITNEDLYDRLSKWKLIGQISAGVSLAGIPYIVMVSFINFGDNLLPTSKQLLFLIPFIFVILANIVLMLVPDLFGESLLAKKNQSHWSLFNHNPDSVFWVSLDGDILDVNKGASQLTGYSRDELMTLNFNDLLHERMKPEKVRTYFLSVLSGETSVIESVAKTKDDTLVDVRITAVRIFVKNEVIGVYGIVRDVTNEKKSAATIKSLAYSDDLTGLPNKRKLEGDIQNFLGQEQSFALMYIDFDRFKRINDTFGHFFGDRVIKEIGNRLKNSINSECRIARMGGDEFSILVPDHTKINETAEMIIQRFRNPIKIDGYEFLLTASIGISRYPEDSANLVELMKNADLAMYEAKQSGSNTFKLFSKEMVTQMYNKLELENDLRNAISDGSLDVYFQPKYNTVTQQITGSEALARWNHSRYGFISPAVFIPIAEEAHLIVQLERAVISETLHHIQTWKRQGISVPRTSINVSVIHFYQEDFIQFFKGKLQELELNGFDIEIEVTESIMVKSESGINKVLQELRDSGIQISIDDFGTGYSSLSYLQELSIDRLKIDRSFITNSASKREIVSTIVSMAKNLNLDVIAEGVETGEQIELLQSLGCSEVQGFFYSPAVQPHSYQQLLVNQDEFKIQKATI